jgi:glucokinase
VIGGIYMLYVGIDLGGMTIKGGIVDREGNILFKDSIDTKRERHYKEITKDMANLAINLIEKNNISVKDVKSIGVGSPGIPQTKNGLIAYANNLGFKNVPIRDEIQKYIDLPVYVENDANCAALAENRAGAGKGYESSVTVTLGTGIGGGVIFNDKIYSGFNDAASELGHVIINVDGESCTCGRNGCWEAYASATALIRQTKKAAIENKDSLINKICENNLENINAKTAFDAMREGDKTGKAVVDNYIKYLSEGLINIINLLQPEIILIGGGVSNEKDFLLNPVRDYISKFTYSRHNKNIKQTELKTAQMGNKAGIIGAAMLGDF